MGREGADAAGGSGEGAGRPVADASTPRDMVTTHSFSTAASGVSRPVTPSITVENPGIQRAQRRIAMAVIWVPFLGTMSAIGLMFVFPIGWIEVSLFAVMYVLTSLGITVGFHRHFAHRAFKAAPGMRVFLGVAGSMAAQGNLIYWAATHRRHHRFSEEACDPHSPYTHEGRDLGFWRGLYHSHLGWMLNSKMTNTAVFARDLIRDPLVVRVNNLYLLWVALGLLVPAAMGGVLNGSWLGVLNGLLWGGFVRMFCVHHMMWTSGSTAHMFGTRPFVTMDHSRNNIVLAPFNLGEAWHNNHHAFPNSARFGLSWWQLDPGAWFIGACQKIGFVWDVRAPSRDHIRELLEKKNSMVEDDGDGLVRGYEKAY